MIYSKLGSDNKMHLYITAEGTDTPAQDDIQLTYKDNAGEELDIQDYKFFYNAGTFEQQIKASEEVFTTTEEDVKVNVWADDELIIGTVDKAKVSFDGTLVENTTLKVNGTTITSEVVEVEVAIGKVTITLTPAEGYVFEEVPSITIGGTTTNFSIEGGVATHEFDVEEDTTFSITASVIVAN